MKKAGLALLGLSMMMPGVAGAQTINAQEGFYIGAGGGAAWFIGSNSNTNTWTGWAVGGKVGYDFVGPRLELEGSYGQIPVSANIPGTAINGKVGQVAVMANILYDFMPTSVITPYIGAGAGIAFVDSNSSLGSTQFAYQGILGVAYNVSEQLRFMVEGRYFGTTNPNVNTPFGNVSFQNQNILALVGVSYKFTAPMTLYSNLSREMWKIDEDMTGENYCGGGYCSEHMNMRRYGDKAKGQPNCQDNLEKAIRGYGMDRWNFNVDACFNVFMTVAYDADGKWEIRLPKGKPGDYMVMTALMPQIVAISNCPILFNACNNYKLTPLTLEILK